MIVAANGVGLWLGLSCVIETPDGFDRLPELILGMVKDATHDKEAR